jgi:hypothetical protein
VPDGELAVEVAGADGDARGERLTELLDGSGVLRPAPAGGPADARCYLLAPRADAGAGPVPQLGALDAAVWAVVGADGTARLYDDLQSVARYRRAIALENTSAASAAERSISSCYAATAPAGPPADAQPGGLPVYRAGDAIAFELRNDSDRALYATILDFGLMYRIFKAHPPGASEQLAAGRTVRVRVDPTRELHLGFPDDYPFAAEPGEGSDSGVETLRLFASTTPTDFAPLLQPSVQRGRRGGDSALGRLMVLVRPNSRMR